MSFASDKNEIELQGVYGLYTFRSLKFIYF